METHSQGTSKDRTEKIEYTRKLNNTLSNHQTHKLLVFVGCHQLLKATGQLVKPTNHSAVLTDRNLSPCNPELLPRMRTHLYSSSLLDPLLKTLMASSAHDLHLGPSLAPGSHRGLFEYSFQLVLSLGTLKFYAVTPQHSSLLFLLLYPRSPQCCGLFLVSLPPKPSWTHSGSQEPQRSCSLFIW